MRPYPNDELSNVDSLYIIDYGLAKRFSKEMKEGESEFRGTSLYASLNSHDKKTLSKRDDLWSLFYVFLDLLKV